MKRCAYIYYLSGLFVEYYEREDSGSWSTLYDNSSNVGGVTSTQQTYNNQESGILLTLTPYLSIAHIKISGNVNFTVKSIIIRGYRTVIKKDEGNFLPILSL